MAKTVWLKWNGTYDLSGLCNTPLTPLDAAGGELVKAVKERLYLLGFDCGELDGELNTETKKALLTFNGYWNHPTIHRLCEPCERCHMTTLLPAFNDPLVNPPVIYCAANEHEEDYPFERYCDDATIECFKQMEDKGQIVEKPEPEGLRRMFINLSRRTNTGSGYSASINRATPLAVKVVSVPAAFEPFENFAGINVSIKGYKRVKSLLLRIYRNCDPDEDEIAVPGEKMIYQEILDEKAVRSLSGKEIEDNIGTHHPAKAFIMRQEIGGGFSGFLRQYLGSFYEKLHASYRVRVWVSTIAGAFDQYAFVPSPNMPKSRQRAVEHENLHYLNTDHIEQIRRERGQQLAAAAGQPGGAYRIEPEINYMETVHDRSNRLRRDESEEGVIKRNWSRLRDWNAALGVDRYWTTGNDLETNLIDELCPDHTAGYMSQNALKEEAIVNTFANDPVTVYIELRERLDADGVNFSYPELLEVFQNIKRHINLVKRRLCCGQWRHVDDAVRNDVVPFMDNTVLPDLEALIEDGFPYENSMLFCQKFMSFFSHIVHEALVKPELSFYDEVNIGDGPGETYEFWVRDRRNRIDSCKSLTGSEVGQTEGHYYGRTSGNYRMNDAVTSYIAKNYGDCYPMLKSKVAGVQDERRLAKPILLPSYNPLDPHFFVKIRSVPMYAVGMLDMQYLNADGIRQIPIGFFEHDMFHVAMPNRGTQQWMTLHARLRQILDADEHVGRVFLFDEETIYKKWQGNIEKIDAEIERQGAKNDQEALAFLFFWVLHEPKSGSNDEWKAWLQAQGHDEAASEQINEAFPHPELPEPALIRNRLIYGHEMAMRNIRNEDLTDFFGTYSHSLMPRMAWAKQMVDALLPQLEDL